MVTFNPTIAPTYDSPKEKSFRIMTNNFGDGYAQRVEDGIQNVKEVWQLRWNLLTTVQANNISDFFDARGGTEPFAWVTPNGETKNFILSDGKYVKTPIAYNLFSMSATLEQDWNH